MIGVEPALENPDFSVIVPLKNEMLKPARAEAFCANLEDLYQRTSALDATSEVIFVDDGSNSKDRSADVAESYGFTVVRIDHLGKGGALKAGFELASGNVQAFMDADGAISVPDVFRLVNLVQTEVADVAIAKRTTASHASLLRRRGHEAMHYLEELILPIGLDDTKAGAKAMNKAAAEQIISRLSVNGFAVDLQMLHLAQRLGFTIAEMDVTAKQVNNSHVNVLTDPFKMIIDAMRIKYQARSIGQEEDQVGLITSTAV